MQKLKKSAIKACHINDMKKKTQIIKDKSKITGLSNLTGLRHASRRFSQQDKDIAIKKIIRLPEELPIINDLSLSDIDDGFDKRQLFKLKSKIINKNALLKQKTMKILNKSSEEEISQNNINNTERSLISKDEEDIPILKERKVLFDISNNFNVRSEFHKPHSILSFLNKQKKENINEERLKYIEKKYERKKKKK